MGFRGDAVRRLVRALEAYGCTTRGGNIWNCPAHDDSDPSLSISQGKRGAVVYCHAGCEYQTILSTLGMTPEQLFDDAPDAAKPGLQPAANPERNYELETLGMPTDQQIRALCAAGRIRNAGVLSTIQCQYVRARFRNRERAEWRAWSEYIGFPTLAESWQLWGFNGAGKEYTRKGRLLKLNAGPVSLVVSPDLGGSEILLDRLWDVEGISDLIAGLEHGLRHVIASTGGAVSLAAHTRHMSWLLSLSPSEVVVIRDRDDAGQKGAEKVAEWWIEQGISVRVLRLPSEVGEGGDLRDYLNGNCTHEGARTPRPIGTVAALQALVESAEARISSSKVESLGEKAPYEGSIEELAGLSAMEYDRSRKSAARDLGVRVITLDADVEKERSGAVSGAGTVAGLSDLFPTIEPWPQPVLGTELLSELVTVLRRFLILPEHADSAIALWVIHAHAHDTALVSPLLAFVSPEKRCGKTTALGLLRRVVPRALSAANLTTAVLFRTIERWSPTLLLDEADTFIGYDAQLIGVLNSGHNRDGAKVLRTVGENYEPKPFGTWAPKAIALIGSLPSTLEDRSIVISMKRRTRDEKVSRYRSDRDYGLHDLARRCVRWVKDHEPALREADPDLPESLHDRAADNWRPLVAIGDEAAGVWPERAREAAQVLSSAEDEGSSRVLLLSDIREIYEGRADGWLSSKALTDELNQLQDRPWSEYRKGGKPLSTVGLARLLKPFNIRPEKARAGQGTERGYRREAFEDAFVRFLPVASISLGEIQPEQSEQPREIKELGQNPVGTKAAPVPTKNPGILNDSGSVATVPTRTTGDQEGTLNQLEEGTI